MEIEQNKQSNLLLKLKILIKQKMSSRRYESPSFATPKTKISNPEAIYSHMQRMQSLLQEYDRENLFLNRQVLDLLNRKQYVQPNRDLYQYKLNLNTIGNGSVKSEHKARDLGYERKIGAKQVTGEIKIGSKSKRVSLAQVASLPGSVEKNRARDMEKERKSSETKKYYQYVEQSQVNKSSNKKQDKAIVPTRYKYYYTEEDKNIGQSGISEKENNNVSPKPFKILPEPQASTRKSTRDIIRQSKPEPKPPSPQKRSRIIIQQQSQRASEQSQSQARLAESIKEDINASVNYIPLIKREVYCQSPDNTDRRNSMASSPERERPYINASRLSLKSSKSSKSGIEVTLSEKSQALSKEKKKEQAEQIESKETAEVKKEEKKDEKKQEKGQVKLVKQPSRISESIMKMDDRLNQTAKISIQEQMKPVQQNKPVQAQKPAPKTQPQIQPQIELQIPPTQHQSQTPYETPTFKPTQLNLHNPSLPLISQQPFNPIVLQMPFNPVYITGPGPQYEGHPLMKNRSFSQHRIQPSQKISYGEPAQYARTDSKKELRGRSIQGRKKFINIVSCELLAAKAGEAKKAGQRK